MGDNIDQPLREEKPNRWVAQPIYFRSGSERLSVTYCVILQELVPHLDSAAYGESLLTELAKRLTNLKVSNCSSRQLYRYLRFYRLYPEIVGTLPPQLQEQLPNGFLKSHTGRHEVEKVGAPSPQLRIPSDKLIHRLSYSHFEPIADLDDNLKRTFYEIECIRGNRSVRELKRQIGSLYYERSGFAENKEKLAKLVQSGAEKAEQKLAIRDPYIFEFLGIKSREVMSETDICPHRHGQQAVRL